MSDNTPEPDFKAMARKLAEAKHPLTHLLSGIEYAKQMGRREVYSSCMEKKLNSDRETIRLLKECRDAMASNDVHGWADGLEAHLSSLLKQFQP